MGEKEKQRRRGTVWAVCSVQSGIKLKAHSKTTVESRVKKMSRGRGVVN